MTTIDQTTADERTAYIAGLHALADALETNPGLALPLYGGEYTPLAVYLVGEKNQREQLAAWAKAIPGRKSKVDRDNRLDLKGAFHGLHISVTVARDEVCEKVVLGTHEVTEEIPDPELLAAVPIVSVTRTVEDVQWICHPLLPESAGVSA